MNTDEHEENHPRIPPIGANFLNPISSRVNSRNSRIQFSSRKIEIRAVHEIMAARTTQVALLVDQLMPALRTPAPVLAENIFVRRRGANIVRRQFQNSSLRAYFGFAFPSAIS
jgi:hypothetical protein